MKKILLVMVLLAATLKAAAQDEWRNNVQMRLDSLLSDTLMQTTQLGLMVYDLTEDTCLFAYNEKHVMRPASTMKLFTAITALDLLGADYKYSTTLYLAGSITDGTLTGDIYCVGGMDPMIDDADLDTMVMEMAAQGVKRIRGRLFADRSMTVASEKYGEGWCWDDKNPELTPLLVNRKPNFLGRLLAAMKRNGINARMTKHNGEVPHGSVAVLARKERLLTEVMTDVMRISDNLYAETMFYQIAAADGRRPAKAKDAVARIKELVGRVMPQPGMYYIADGSGLSLYNYVTPEMETMLLRYAYLNPHIYTPLYKSLPIAGVYGSLEKRMTETAAFGNVRAKTGTLSGISSLAGYCTASNGHQLCFTIINQGVMRGKMGRDFQDKVCTVICE